MAYELAFWVRVGSSALFILLGVAVLIVGRRRRGPLALGLYLITYAMTNVLTNLRIEVAAAGTASPLAPSAIYLLAFPFFVAAAVTGFLAAAWLLEGGRPRRALAYGLVVGGLAALGMLGYQGANDTNNIGLTGHLQEFRIGFTWLVTLALAGAVATSAWRTLQTRPDSRSEWVRAMAFPGLMAPGIIVVWVSRFGDPWSWATLASMLALILGITAPLLALAIRAPAMRAGRLAWIWPAFGLAAYLYLLLPVNALNTTGFHDAYGLNGVLRVVGWTFLVYAILTHDLLGVPLPHFAVKRGTIAAGALATLFIVAQVAQNFFSAQYGLLTGGIVAGAFLFAASPVQRAIEHAGDRSSPKSRPGGAPPVRAGKHQEAAFRDAVRLAWRDRRFDQSEEVTLANLADSMGLTAKRATEIRHEVEREKGVA